MNYTCSSFLIILYLISLTCAQNCKPLNCSASCTPGCSSNEVCTLGTMVVCGVCPDSKCISRTVLGLPPINSDTTTTTDSSSPSSNNKKNGLIGGLVGGLLGGGFILGTMGYFLIYRRQKKNRLPLALGHVKNEERNISGVIPVTFIPPTRNIEEHSAENDDNVINPFSDRHISILTTTTTTSYQRRDSVESCHHVATQITRAKPQIMRVNTIKDGLGRQGSVKKTIQPTLLTVNDEDNPFDDRNKTRNSVLSAPGDGEITIFWNGS
ncbi:uncharacterized protein BX663DRAFT_561676 [Cokeromyces recurvatus]|uniref:uncharacterized protein n=1 Tax=Cokeromyces recurvatus TaxID=90255 RepID=UPI002220DE87|nr:uncharacterized protein BX663DRAFT_561676 [Cokeromyces recurvatus]KAI7902084.1 hypothetical protein BX663DRAFT_561676 [Cokeromyces recurvatus]